MRLLLSLCASKMQLVGNPRRLARYDVNCAFMHADLDEVIYVKPPPDVAEAPDEIWKLHKAANGTRRASLLF